MSLNESEQRSRLARIAEAAKEEGCFVAPVGSVYFLLTGAARAATKDVDAVIHGHDFRLPSLEVLKQIGQKLGETSATEDGAVVQVRTSSGGSAEIELIRGRSGAKRGFFPRELLIDAANHAKREGNILVYPLEFVLVLKADAAIDRDERAARDPTRAAEHERRANAFRGDVFSEVQRALAGNGISSPLVEKAVKHLKEKRRERVRDLLSAAGVRLA
jgi:hypothetical protein